MKLYLHIGLSKTGTSAIQTFFYDYREYLINRYGILYPHTGIFKGGGIPAHYFLAFSLYKPCEAQNLFVPKTFEQYIEDLKSEINQVGTQTVVISSEAFMHIKDNSILERFYEKLSYLFDSITIVVYLRRQDLWHESSYKQVIKAFGTRYDKEFKFSVSHSLNLQWLLDYNNLLDRWRNSFQDARVIARIYNKEELIHKNIILDFLSSINIDLYTSELDIKIFEKYKAINPSLSHLSTLVMRKINEKFNLTPEEHGKCIQYLFKLDREEGSPIKTFFTLPERIEFLEHFKESNERLFQEWFNSENRFVLSEEEIKFYEEQDKIPRSEIEKMVEDRYRKVLTYLMEENVKPQVYFQNMSKPKIFYYQNEKIEYMNVDVVQVDLLKGKMIIGGLVLLKEEINENFKLTSKVNGKEFEVKWRLPSPGLVSKYPDNPNAKEARFQITGLEANYEKIEIMLNDVKIIEIKFSKG